MYFYMICKMLGLNSKETKNALQFLIQKFPFGEHVELTKEELKLEIEEWISDQKWNEICYTDIAW